MSVIEGYILDKDFSKGIERFEDSFYKSGFLNSGFYELFLHVLCKSTVGSQYAVHELFYKLLKDQKRNEEFWTCQMLDGFLKCCIKVYSSEKVYQITKFFAEMGKTTEFSNHILSNIPQYPLAVNLLK